MPTDDKYADLRAYLPPQRAAAPRKMLSIRGETHEALTKLSEDLNMPRSLIIDALIKFYLDEE